MFSSFSRQSKKCMSPDSPTAITVSCLILFLWGQNLKFEMDWMPKVLKVVEPLQ